MYGSFAGQLEIFMHAIRPFLRAAIGGFCLFCLAASPAFAITDFCAKPAAKKTAVFYFNQMKKSAAGFLGNHNQSDEITRRTQIRVGIAAGLKKDGRYVDNISTHGDSLHYIHLGVKSSAASVLTKSNTRSHIAFLWPFSVSQQVHAGSKRLSAFVIKNGNHSLGARIHFCHYRFANQFLGSTRTLETKDVRITNHSSTMRLPGNAKAFSKKAQRFDSGVGANSTQANPYLNRLHVIFINAESKRRSGSFWLLIRNAVGKGQPSTTQVVKQLAATKCKNSGNAVACKLVKKLEPLR